MLIEAGPGNVLTTLARQQAGPSAKAFPSLPHPRENVSAFRCALETLGRVWTLGVNVDWSKLHAAGSVQRVSLPTYPFERQKFWIEPDRAQRPVAPTSVLAGSADSEAKLTQQTDWLSLYRRAWKLAPVVASTPGAVGPWLLFRDSLGIADELATKLKSTGQQAILVDVGDSYRQLKKNRYKLRPAVRADYDALIADLIAAGEMPKQIIHLWSLTPAGAEPPLDESLERSFLSPLYLAQALAAQDLEGISIAFVSERMQQVTDEPVPNPARAVLLGPARVIPRELPGISTRAIDLSGDDEKAADSAAHLVAEMSAADPYTTSAWRNGERYVESLGLLDLSLAPERIRLESGGVYLITGGLGALGLAVAEHLAREFKARLVLVGRSPLPPASEWDGAIKDPALPEAEKARLRRLVEIRDLSRGLLVIQGDVADRADMERAVATACAQFEKIDGVLHTAGVLDDGPLMLKTATSTAHVLNPKVRGTLVLEDALRGQSLKCFVLFSSISAVTPPAGQVDYAAANAFLDAFAASRKGPVISINWGAWREIGMAARSASPHPWLDERLLETPDAIVYSSRLSQHRHWMLAEHRFKNGTGLLPGTAYLELAAAAFARGSHEGAIEFSDVFFVAPLMCPSTESRDVRVELRREQEHEAAKRAFQFSIFARADDSGWTECATGVIAPCGSHRVLTVDRAAIAARCRMSTISFDDEHPTRQERELVFGSRWRSLRRLHLGKGEGLAEIELDEKFSADVATLRQHPALLDMATGAALYLTDDYDHCNDLFLPIAYRKMCVYGALPARLYSHIRVRNDGPQGGELETFDITLFDEQNQILAEIEGFAMRRIADVSKTTDGALPSPDAAGAVAQPMEVAAHLGIAPAEGVRTLMRLLRTETPAVVAVLPQPIEASAPHLREAMPLTSVPASEAGDIEATLALWWRELLGIEQVRPEDDFFDLGGHSLVGVRLFAKIKKTFQVDLELASLFQARTLHQLAEVIRKACAPVARELKSWSALVPIQPNGSRIPLFLVHAAGGEVISYAPLARYLDSDQPLYGFRSPFTIQQDIRETSIPELASAFIRELQDFYPRGPYLIGGHSFGGLVAFEMARQLSAVGANPAMVLLIDTKLPGSAHRIDVAVQFSTVLRTIRNEGTSFLMRRVKAKPKFWLETLSRRIEMIACSLYRRARRPLPASLRYALIEDINWKALTAYSVKPYEGRINLIRANDRSSRGIVSLRERDDELLGWGTLAQQGVEVCEVTGDHRSLLLDPNVRAVAEEIQTILSRVEAAQVTAHPSLIR